MSAKLDALVIPAEHYALANGLTVVLSVDHRLPLVAVNLAFRAGTGMGGPGQGRYAHLVRHLLRGPTRHIDSPHELLDSIGADVSGGDGMELFEDLTDLHEMVPPEQLAAALRLESDRMAFSIGSVDDARLRAAVNEVLAEQTQPSRFEGLDNAPDLVASCRFFFPKPHPYAACDTGADGLAQATPESVAAWFQHWFGAENAVLTLAGDFEPAHARELIEIWFGPIRGGTVPELPNGEQWRPISIETKKVVDSRTRYGELDLMWPGPRLQAPEVAVADVAARVLSFRLWLRRIGREHSEGYHVECTNMRLGGYCLIASELRAGEQPSEPEQIALAELERLKREPPDPVDIARSQTVIWRDYVKQLEPLDARAWLLGRCMLEEGRADCYERQRLALLAVTPQAVSEFAQRWLPENARFVLRVQPRKAGR